MPQRNAAAIALARARFASVTSTHAARPSIFAAFSADAGARRPADADPRPRRTASATPTPASAAAAAATQKGETVASSPLRFVGGLFSRCRLNVLGL